MISHTVATSSVLPLDELGNFNGRNKKRHSLVVLGNLVLKRTNSECRCRQIIELFVSDSLRGVPNHHDLNVSITWVLSRIQVEVCSGPDTTPSDCNKARQSLISFSVGSNPCFFNSS